jgi:uncharacterized protein YabE (DUF348 family)
MKRVLWMTFVVNLLLSACQGKPVNVTIFADGQSYHLHTTQRVPSELLTIAGLTLDSEDRILYLGAPTPPDIALDANASFSLTVRRAVTLLLITPQSTQTLHASATSVGQALIESGIPLYASDRIDPPVETPLVEGMTVTYQPAVSLLITVDGFQMQVRSAAETVGQALAEVGVPLVGLDYSVPSAESAIPTDRNLRVVRVTESVSLIQKSLPYSSRFEGSADLELDQQDVLQLGEPGLAMSRVHIRTEDGSEIGRTTEAEVVIRPPQDKVVGFGTNVVVRTAEVDGVTISYWRAVQVYATSYSPCRSGADRCYSGTASGKAVQKGVIAVASRWYPYLVGTGVYVPGYGLATVEDIGGGFPDRYWIDLAYSDADWVSWGSYITLYFLTPIPANIQYVLPFR